VHDVVHDHLCVRDSPNAHRRGPTIVIRRIMSIEEIAGFGSATLKVGRLGRVVREILLLREQGYPYDVIWDSVALPDLLRGSNGYDG
jgi:hypothetical protein